MCYAMGYGVLCVKTVLGGMRGWVWEEGCLRGRVLALACHSEYIFIYVKKGPPAARRILLDSGGKV